MGMAASQARYLALAARKTNCEYQGQQINQARLNLANQTATLFNQMLGLNVPVPPSTQDFTIMQYSFTDGINPAVIDKWEQLSNPDADGYNYVVEFHYDANVYTGFQKKMNDPQIQFATNVPTVKDFSAEKADVTKIWIKEKALAKAQKDYDEAQAAYTAEKTRASKLATYRDLSTTSQKCQYTKHVTDGGKDQYEIYATNPPTVGASPLYTFVAYDKLNYGAETTSDSNVYYRKIKTKTGEDPNFVYTFEEDDNKCEKLSQNVAAGDIGTDVGKYMKVDNNTNIYIAPSGAKTTSTKATVSGAEVNNAQSWVEDPSSTAKDAPKAALDAWTGDGIKNDDTSKLYYCEALNAFAYKDDLDSLNGIGLLGSALTTLPIYNVGTSGSEDQPGKDYASIYGMSTKLTKLKDAEAEAMNALKNAEAEVETLNKPTYLGNTKLESLYELSQEEFAEIKQIITDMNKNGVSCNFLNCFDTALSIDAGHYTGGIYKFQRDGVTYYTTYFDLADTAIDSEFSNDIDNQPKLNYYHANYVTQPVYKTDKAILDTDSQGRFKTVRFKEDGAQYTLNFEQKTDDDAYQDAMNKYYYENAKYDKMVQDINAKTSLIQQEDRTLELKLKQLDTEQNALSNEMEAVQKIVKDGVEKGFKTFGG